MLVLLASASEVRMTTLADANRTSKYGTMYYLHVFTL